MQLKLSRYRRCWKTILPKNISTAATNFTARDTASENKTQETKRK